MDKDPLAHQGRLGSPGTAMLQGGLGSHPSKVDKDPLAHQGNKVD